ncbi:MAG: ribosome biogenesis GTP-binding protein YihA/YsxC [Steroidobacteraceae bacterium]
MLSVASHPQYPPDQGFEVAIAGRSNAGKSTAINALTGRHALARASKTPGRTQLVNYFELQPDRRLVDLPGYGYAAAPAAVRGGWSALTDGLLTRGSFRGLLLIVDSRRGLGDGDAGLIEWAGLKPEFVHVLLSKADQVKKSEAREVLERSREDLDGIGSVQLFSALKNMGIEEARKTLLRWFA